MDLKKTLLQLLIIILIILSVILISNSRKKGEFVSLAGFVQGTTYHITYESRTGENLQQEIDSLLADFDMSLSIYQPNSVISRINRNEPGVKADQKFITVFNVSRQVFENTDGAFDITVGPIINALGFGSTDTVRVDSALIDSLLQFVGMDKISLEHDMLIKTNTNIRIDVNAIAQGYSVDLVADFLSDRKIRNFLVEIGGEIRAKGRNDRNQVWRIGIDKPMEGNMIPGADLQAIVRLQDRSLATSGNYRKYYEKGGIKFVHTIDPKSGYPVVSSLLSATVIADDCMTADAYATALMVLGIKKSVVFLNEHNFLDAYLIFADHEGKFRVYATPGIKKFIDE